jgi:hypothetical protein
LHDADSIAEDPSEFFTMIFGGEAFVDWYGTAAATQKSGQKRLTYTGLARSH